MANPATHTDLLIRIGAPAAASGRFPVEATIDGDSLFYGGFLALDRARLRPWELDPPRYGAELLAALFSEPVARAYERAVAKADERSGGRLRFRLQIDPEASALHAVHWERLCQRRDGRELPLAVTTQTPFSRFTGLERATVLPLTQRPIRVLVAIANPSGLERRGLVPIDVDDEVRSLCNGLGNLSAGHEVAVTVLPGRTELTPALREDLVASGFQVEPGPTTLDNLLARLRDFHVIHLLGHGAFRQGEGSEPGTAALFLEAVDGSVALVKDTDLVPRLAAAEPLPHLVFLAACESARRDAQSPEPFVGLGPKLVEAGVPAVVAMQEKVPMALATELTRHFYESLFRHGVIDQALNEARWLLYDTDSGDWSIPVLFMRARDGRLFEPNPIRTALQAMVQRTEEAFASAEPPLPIDVVRVPPSQNHEGLERFEQSDEAGVDIGVATRELLEPCATDPGESNRLRFGVLLGREGTARSTHMKQLVGEIASRSLQQEAGRIVIPLYVDLEDYVRTHEGVADPFDVFLSRALAEDWPGLGTCELRALLADTEGPDVLILIDGSDDLAEHQRARVWGTLSDFAHRYPRQRCLLTCNLHRFVPEQLPVSDVFVVKVMSRPRVVAYLKTMRDRAGRELLEALEQARLFDLAGLPWLLVLMLKQTRQGKTPHSRTSVLKYWVDRALAGVPAEGGKRARAEQTLHTLAMEAQRSRRRTIAVDRALDLMAPVRGGREYPLYDLLQDLVAQQLLVPLGQEAVRFGYPAVQAYCCAAAIESMSDWTGHVDDITATLGRLSRLRWWEDTLVLLSGMTKEVDSVVRSVLYGSSFTQGEQVFLAARCIQEVDPTRVSAAVLNQVVDALIWRTNASNEPRAWFRCRAIAALGELQVEDAIPHLANLVLEPVRLSWDGRQTTEYSSVRLAAITALGQMLESTRVYVKVAYPEFDPLLEAWVEGDIPALGQTLMSGDPRTAPIAAFLLCRLPTPLAVDWLIRAFRSVELKGGTRWALADALAMADPVRVAREAILPFIDADAASTEGLSEQAWRRRADWYERVVYLIGKARPRDERAHRFLDRCLFELKDVWLKGRAIRAIAALRWTRHKALLEDLALGDLSGFAVSDRIKPDEEAYLRRVAIEALSEIGDEGSLMRLRAKRAGWSPEMDRAFYRASEEIYWRVSERSRPSSQ